MHCKKKTVHSVRREMEPTGVRCDKFNRIQKQISVVDTDDQTEFTSSELRDGWSENKNKRVLQTLA